MALLPVSVVTSISLVVFDWMNRLSRKSVPVSVCKTSISSNGGNVTHLWTEHHGSIDTCLVSPRKNEGRDSRMNEEARKSSLCDQSLCNYSLIQCWLYCFLKWSRTQSSGIAMDHSQTSAWCISWSPMMPQREKEKLRAFLASLLSRTSSSVTSFSFSLRDV